MDVPLVLAGEGVSAVFATEGLCLVRSGMLRRHFGALGNGGAAGHLALDLGSVVHVAIVYTVREHEKTSGNSAQGELVRDVPNVASERVTLVVIFLASLILALERPRARSDVVCHAVPTEERWRCSSTIHRGEGE